MKTRCKSTERNRFPYYGGKGIKVCERWNSYSNFLNDMGERPIGKTIDRINGTGDYEPGNCRWSTPKEQARNRSNNQTVDFNGERLTLIELCERFGVSVHVVRHRLRRGMDINKSISMPLHTMRNLALSDESKKASEMAAVEIMEACK